MTMSSYPQHSSASPTKPAAPTSRCSAQPIQPLVFVSRKFPSAAPVSLALPAAPTKITSDPATPPDTSQEPQRKERAGGVSLNTPSTQSLMPSTLQMPPTRDPSLSSSGKPVEYVDIFVDDFIGLAQQYSEGFRVRRILIHAIDGVLSQTTLLL